MDRLSDITGLEVSQIQGGMSRSRMLAALNKPIILATPDVIHWFFRKNVNTIAFWFMHYHWWMSLF